MSLTIDFEHRTKTCCPTEYGCSRHHSFFDGLVTILKHGANIRRLNIVSWPSFVRGLIPFNLSPGPSELLHALEIDAYLAQNLEHLSLFWLDDFSISELKLTLPTPIETFTLVSKFERLTTLCLRSPMLSDELLICLASQHNATLETVKILLHYWNDVYKRYDVPRLHPQAWRSLVQTHPRLRVEVSVLWYTPHDNQLSHILAPDVPVSKFCIMKLAWVPVSTITKLQKMYCKTLQEFACYSVYSTKNVMDKKLIKLCESCDNITRFVFHGRIRVETVARIAKLRGHAWEKFEVKAVNLIVPSQDDDDVSGTGTTENKQNSELNTTDIHRVHDEQSTYMIQTMAKEVSEFLGRPWKPIFTK